jgi:hypothetical protein
MPWNSTDRVVRINGRPLKKKEKERALTKAEKAFSYGFVFGYNVMADLAFATVPVPGVDINPYIHEFHPKIEELFEQYDYSGSITELEFIERLVNLYKEYENAQEAHNQ